MPLESQQSGETIADVAARNVGEMSNAEFTIWRAGYEAGRRLAKERTIALQQFDGPLTTAKGRNDGPETAA